MGEAAKRWGTDLDDATSMWLDMIQRETGLLIALLRDAAEQRSALYAERKAIVEGGG